MMFGTGEPHMPRILSGIPYGKHLFAVPAPPCPAMPHILYCPAYPKLPHATPADSFSPACP